MSKEKGGTRRRNRAGVERKKNEIALSSPFSSIAPFFSRPLDFSTKAFSLLNSPPAVFSQPHCPFRSFEGEGHVERLASEADSGARKGRKSPAPDGFRRRRSRATQDRCCSLFLFSCLLVEEHPPRSFSPWSSRAPGCCPCWRHCPCPGRSRDPGRP